MKRKKSILWILPIIICIGMIAYALGSIFLQYQEYETAKNEYDMLVELAHAKAEDSDTQTSDGLDIDTEQDDIPPDESSIDFAALQAMNPDIVGWIVIDGTNINYPIVQGGDNQHYLNYTYTGTANSAGSIFMDYRNTPDFTDSNTIIYGQKMKNGTMFHDLSEYKSQTFLEEHSTFTIYTPEYTYRCEVFAAYVTSSTSETYVLDFGDTASFVQYMNTAIERSLIQTGTVLYSTDKIVTAPFPIRETRKSFKKRNESSHYAVTRISRSRLATQRASKAFGESHPMPECGRRAL